MVNILYFASLREQLECSGETFALPPAINTVAALRDYLQQRGGCWALAFDPRQPLISAVNQEIAPAHTPIGDGDEVAFFPPVTGG
ncbi:molybdopterin converting factor subunit 1 [Chromatium okenii]|uniref:molybdopterin converting factor subunit 1 n=1 Tax=Chromatium okenii TaxID=61644 RepID=UPI0026ED014E|nr:molybdopterin converting factor subunit 1 [Chromatium okenii]MBV5308323.1 molybdopterin converting factor subunit 1 [Chromatium okenii]MBV5311291.1 molybdopterin converting factor subunit 1 [Chromatium okenii]